ncbi:MAG: hypothetical protein L0Z54_06415, partial [Thermoplasmata archaeon]|nr:hypothetical protein [Thermoplasmata archaeon]
MGPDEKQTSRIVAMTIAAALIGSLVFVQCLPEADGFGMSVLRQTIQGRYLVHIDDDTDLATSSVRYTIMDGKGEVAKFEGPDGTIVPLQGRLAEVTRDETRIERAIVSGLIDRCTWDETFYPDTDAGNQTLHVSFIDRGAEDIEPGGADDGSDRVLDKGDHLWVRSAKDGGVVRSGYILVLNDVTTGDEIGRVRFPSAQAPLRGTVEATEWG